MTPVLLLAACSLGPAYHRPALDLPDSYRGESPGRTDSLGDLAWWNVYRDPQLQALIRTALAGNRDVQLAAARVRQARALYGVSQLARLPQVDASLGALKGRSLTLGQYASGTEYSAGIQVSWEIDFWRRLSNLSEAARADLLASEQGREAVESSLVGDVATAWFDLVALDRKALITARTADTRQRFLDLTRSKFRRGAAAGLDVSRAEASLALARADLPDLRRQIEQTENRLQVLLGANPTAVTRQDADLPLPPEVPAGLPSSLLERRPDLRQAESVLRGAGARTLATKAELFPTLSLTGSLGSESLALADLFTGPARVWSFGAGILQPLLDAQHNGRRLEAARAQEEQALILYAQAVAQAFREVSDALIARRFLAQVLDAQEQQVRSLGDASRRVLKRYEIGFSSYFEVVDADRDLYTAQLQEVQARHDLLLATVQLYKALGGGWQRE